MGWVIHFAKSSLGAKLLMALTGLMLFGFVVVHMLGNLQVFLGQDAYNAYASFLKGTPELLWAARVALLAAAVLHVISGLRLAAINRAARPQPYHMKRFIKASFTSRTMVLSGLLLLSFIVYHLLHFTVGVIKPEYFDLLDAKGRHDVYSMFILGFQNIYISAAYVISMIFLGMHLKHGASSLFQTLGLNHPRYNALLQAVGPVSAVVIVVGNVSMPVAVLMGWLQLPAGVVK